MLTKEQTDRFATEGVLVVENILPPELLTRIRAEYAQLLDILYDDWHAQGLVPSPGRQDFWAKLLTAYKAGCDWFQPM
ncbi:MAG: phytanoyl-CoA dioxygenase, partial [Pseudooceanicola sp.]|nr:phytanoyl-CoA dioxygenase [Pseudooceanicola sp.]